eukprot:11408660-Heterocapsa_arctica.AAC.1
MGRVRRNLGFRKCSKRISRLSNTGGRARGQMFENNPDTDRCTRLGRFQRKDGQKKSKQNGKRSNTLKQYSISEKHTT